MNSRRTARPDGRYRTAPLRGLWTHTRGGFYHDGRFATLADVIAHYDQHFDLGLSAERATGSRGVSEVALTPRDERTADWISGKDFVGQASGG